MSYTPQCKYVEGLILGKSSVLHEIYQKFAPRIIDYIRRKGGKREDGQDIFQEALIIIFQKAQKIEFELKSSFYSFLFGICRNLWLQKIIPETKRKIKIPTIELIITNESDKEEVSRERFKLYEKYLNQLSEKNRQILQLSAQDFSNKEIAEKMGIESYGYIRIKKMRAKKELMGIIRKDPIYNELRLF
jgi:RNA polymerase sigma factor (sigma-70 family)